MSQSILAADRMTVLQGYFDALQYNHTGTQFFNINKKLAMRSLMDVRMCMLSIATLPASDGA